LNLEAFRERVLLPAREWVEGVGRCGSFNYRVTFRVTVETATWIECARNLIDYFLTTVRMRHACGYALAKGTMTHEDCKPYLGHRYIQHTVR
jgi:hypothetical protein